MNKERYNYYYTNIVYILKYLYFFKNLYKIIQYLFKSSRDYIRSHLRVSS